MTHLPPPPVWRAAQAKARACGLWLDLTMDGVYHVYGLDNTEYATCPTFADLVTAVTMRRAT